MKRFFSKGIVVVAFAAVMVFTVFFAINSKKKHITLVIDGKEQLVETFKETVDEFLIENDIAVIDKDKLNKDNNEVLQKEDKIEITKAVPIKLLADNVEEQFMTAEKSIEGFLASEQIEVGEKDKLSLSKDELIYGDMELKITRVTEKIVENTEELDFSVQEIKDKTLLKGKKVVSKEGDKGERKITILQTYEDGELVKEEETENIVVKEPTDKVIAIGTKEKPKPKPVVAKASTKQTTSSAANLTASRGGTTPSGLSYSKSMKVRATAYSGHTMTASGAVPVRNPNGWSTIAVDRSIIPLGTKVYVENYGYAIAQDVGGAIKGNRIDVFLNSRTESRSWGVRYVNIYILD